MNYLRERQPRQVLIDEGVSSSFLNTAAGRNDTVRRHIMWNIGSAHWYRCANCAEWYARISELPGIVEGPSGADLRVLENKAHRAGFCSRRCAQEIAPDTNPNMVMKAAMIALRPDFYQSDEWRRVRYEVLKIHGRVCQCCGAKPPTELHVDHIRPRITHPYLALSIANLQILCKDCNFGKGWQDDTDWRDQDGG